MSDKVVLMCTEAEKGHSILPFYHSAILLFCHSAVLPFCHSEVARDCTCASSVSGALANGDITSTQTPSSNGWFAFKNANSTDLAS